MVSAANHISESRTTNVGTRAVQSPSLVSRSTAKIDANSGSHESPTISPFGRSSLGPPAPTVVTSTVRADDDDEMKDHTDGNGLSAPLTLLSSGLDLVHPSSLVRFHSAVPSGVGVLAVPTSPRSVDAAAASPLPTSSPAIVSVVASIVDGQENSNESAAGAATTPAGEEDEEMKAADAEPPSSTAFMGVDADGSVFNALQTTGVVTVVDDGTHSISVVPMPLISTVPASDAGSDSMDDVPNISTHDGDQPATGTDPESSADSMPYSKSNDDSDEIEATQVDKQDDDQIMTDEAQM